MELAKVSLLCGLHEVGGQCGIARLPQGPSPCCAQVTGGHCSELQVMVVVGALDDRRDGGRVVCGELRGDGWPGEV